MIDLSTAEIGDLLTFVWTTGKHEVGMVVSLDPHPVNNYEEIQCEFGNGPSWAPVERVFGLTRNPARETH